MPYTDAKAGNPAVPRPSLAAGYPKAGDAGIVKMSNPFDIFRPQVAAVIGLLFILVIFVTMVYGPIAAMLVELFPTKIRYTSMSLPYHIGNGWFGGLLPATAFAIVASTGDIYAGLWYPIIFASITAVVGFFFLPETKDVDIKTELIGRRRHSRCTTAQRAGRGALRGRFCVLARLCAASLASWLPDKLQHDLAAVRTARDARSDRSPATFRARARRSGPGSAARSPSAWS